MFNYFSSLMIKDMAIYFFIAILIQIQFKVSNYMLFFNENAEGLDKNKKIIQKL